MTCCKLQLLRPWMVCSAALMLVVGVGLPFIGCNPANQDAESGGGNTSIKLALNWFPEPEHGGYYAAALNGYYRDAGLDVEILPGGPGAPVIEKLERGQIEFAVANADQVLLKRNQEARVVALLAPLQHTPRCIIVHEESGIERLQDLENLKLAMSPGRPFAEYLKQNATLKDVRIVPYSGRIAAFVADKGYAQQGYVFSEPILARREGANPRALMISDLGFDPYTSCLVTSEAMLSEQPEIVQRFVEASQRGWQDYLADPKQVNEELLRLNGELDEAMLIEAHQALLPLCEQPTDQVWGWIAPERMEELAQQLREIDYVEESLDPLKAFDNQFLR